MLGDLWRNLRYGARTLLKNPGFTTMAVLTPTDDGLDNDS